MSPCILSKKTGDSDMTLVKDGLTINLLCEQAIDWSQNMCSNDTYSI